MHRMLRNIYFTLVVIGTSLLLSGCPWNNKQKHDSEETEARQELINTESSEDNTSNFALIKLNVMDVNGNALLDVSVSSEDFSIESQAYNELQLELRVEASQGRGTLHISKDGYLDGILHRDGIQGSTLESVVLLESPEPIVFNAQTGGGFSQRHGVSVEIQANALVSEAGTDARGDVQLLINTVDISDEFERRAFPGNFQGLARADNEPGTLFSLGVTAIDFYQFGRKLQLKDGEVALLRLPIYVEQNIDGEAINVGDQIPLWTLNERTGVWEEESLGVVVEEPSSPTGLALQATTSHFSYFNVDVWASAGNLNGPAGGGGVRRPPQWCRVHATVTDFDIDQPYMLRLSQVIFRGPVTSSARSSKYTGGIEFSVLQGRNASVFVKKTDTGESTEQSFSCNASTMNLEISVDDSARFTTWFVATKPVFEVTAPGQGYEITKNIVTIGGGFAGDSDDTAQVTSTLGYEFGVSRNGFRIVDYLDTDPETASFAAYIENENGQTDRLDVIEYVDEAAPIVNYESAYRLKETAIFYWNVEGADTLDIVYLGSEPGQNFQIPLETDINADIGSFQIDANRLLGDGYFELRFTNQYGTTSVTVRYIDDEACNDNTDNPCQA